MKKYLLVIMFFALCSTWNIAHASFLKVVAKGSQEVEFNDISVYPSTIYNDDIKLPLIKNGSGVICFLTFDTYIRQLPFEDYTDYNKSEKYEVIYDAFENFLIFRRTICNLSDETWNPGIRTKSIKWYLVK